MMKVGQEASAQPPYDPNLASIWIRIGEKNVNENLINILLQYCWREGKHKNKQETKRDEAVQQIVLVYYARGSGSTQTECQGSHDDSG